MSIYFKAFTNLENFKRQCQISHKIVIIVIIIMSSISQAG